MYTHVKKGSIIRTTKLFSNSIFMLIIHNVMKFEDMKMQLVKYTSKMLF